MNILLEQLTSVHADGVMNGLFVASFFYTFFLAIFQLITSSQKRIGLTFLLFACGFAAFGLFNLFYQQVNGSMTVHIIPSFLTNISKYGAPIGLAIFSFVFMRIASMHSYRAFALYEKYKLLFYTLLALDVLCLLVLAFTHNLRLTLLILIVLTIPHLIITTWFAFIGFKTRLGRITALVFGVMFLAALLVTWMVYTGMLSLSADDSLYLHVLFSLALLATSFITVQFSLNEAQRYFDVRKLDTKNLTDDMFQAMNKRQFFLVYQPKVDVVTNKVCGMEALIRWKHPEHGHVSPVEFIPLAEKTGVITNLCRWTISTAVAHAKMLREHGHELPISLNFSVPNVDPRMVGFLLEQLENFEVPPQMIVIEITESLFLDFNSQVIEALDMLEQAGIKISLDDYGTGFSSLNYLQKTSPNELKIDRSFVMDIETNQDNRSIVRSVMQMSKELNISVVAEGVETVEAESLLKALGCDVIQGYLVAKPMTEEALKAWLSAADNQYV